MPAGPSSLLQALAQGQTAAAAPLTDAQKALLAAANELTSKNVTGGVTEAELRANPNMNAQQLANLHVANYWSNQSEAFSRVNAAMNNGTAQIKQMVTGYDESNEPITQLAITAGGHPGYDTLFLNPTGTPNVYSFTTRNQVAGGNISGIIGANPETGKYAPITNAAIQTGYTPGSPGGWIRNTLNDIGPIGNIALAIATGGLSIPEQLAAQTAMNLAKGNDFEDALKGAGLVVGGSQLVQGISGITGSPATGMDLAADLGVGNTLADVGASLNAGSAGIAALPPTTGLGSGIADLGLPTGTELVTQGGLAPAPVVGQGAELALPTTTPAGFTVGAPAGLTALEAGLQGAQTGAQRGAIAGGIKSALTGEDPVEGALKGAGIGALTGGVGGAAGNVATDLGAGATGSAAASGAAMGATGAALTGGDPLTGLIAGGVGGGIGNLTQGALADSGLDKTVVAPIAQTAGQLAASVATGRTDNLEDLLLSGGLSAGTGYVTSQIPGFSDMSDAAKSAANGAIKSLITTGTINEAALVNAGIQAANAASAKEWATPEARDTAVAAAQTEEDDLAKLFGFKDAAERELANSYGITSGTRWAWFQQQQAAPAVVPPSTALAQESAAGLDQLVNAFTNPDTTASYTGTNVADVTPGAGLPTDVPTEQDYAQLGVGLPTGIETILPPMVETTPEPTPEPVPTYTEAPVGYQEQPAGIETLTPQIIEPAPLPGNGYQQTVVEDGTTKGIKDLIAQMPLSAEPAPTTEQPAPVGIETILPPVVETAPEPIPEPTYTEAPVGYQEQPAGIETVLPSVMETAPAPAPAPAPEPVAVEDGTTKGIEDLIAQMTPPAFEGVDLTGGQTDAYQASNEEEPSVPTLPDNTQVEPKFTPPVPEQPSTPQVADDYTTAGIQDIINQLPGGTGMDETDYDTLGVGLPILSNEPSAADLDQLGVGLSDPTAGALVGLTTDENQTAAETNRLLNQAATATGTPTDTNFWDGLAQATGLSPTTLKWLGAGLGATGLAKLLGQQGTAGAAPTPYTGPLKNIQYNPATFTPYTYKPYAAGGVATGGIANLGGYSDGGRLLRGPGDGVSDSIPAVIGNKQPARLADGEFVIPARIVSELGNGSTEAGARQLYAMMDRIQAARRKTTGKEQVAANTKAAKHLPA